MTNEEINELFATKIWGWNKKEWWPGLSIMWWYDKGSMKMPVNDYTPSTNFLQAFEALEKFCEDEKKAFEIFFQGTRSCYRCIIYSPTIAYSVPISSSTNNKDKATAIYGALIKALEAKNVGR
jgi:hypothetical protein